MFKIAPTIDDYRPITRRNFLLLRKDLGSLSVMQFGTLSTLRRETDSIILGLNDKTVTWGPNQDLEVIYSHIHLTKGAQDH